MNEIYILPAHVLLETWPGPAEVAIPLRRQSEIVNDHRIIDNY